MWVWWAFSHKFTCIYQQFKQVSYMNVRPSPRRSELDFVFVLCSKRNHLWCKIWQQAGLSGCISVPPSSGYSRNCSYWHLFHTDCAGFIFQPRRLLLVTDTDCSSLSSYLLRFHCKACQSLPRTSNTALNLSPAPSLIPSHLAAARW